MIGRRLRGYLGFLRQCLPLLAGQRRIFAVFLAASVLAALTEGASVTLLVPILDTQGGHGAFASTPLLGSAAALFAPLSPRARIEAVAAAMAVLAVLRNLLQYAASALGATIPLRLERRLNRRSHAALLAVEIAYIEQHDYGFLVNGLGGLSERVTIMLTALAQMISGAMILAIYTGLMLAISWRLTVFAMVFVLAMSLVLRWLTSGALHRAGQRLTGAVSRVNQLVMETITGMRVVRLATAEPLMARLYGEALDQANAEQRRIVRLRALPEPVLSTCAGLFVALLLLASAVLDPGQPERWIGGVLLFLFLLFRLMGPVSNISLARTRIVSHLDAFDHLNAFYRETGERRQPNGERPASPLRHGIVFEAIGFAYRDDRPALRDVSLDIGRGQMVAIVGPSGAGKSTLIGLLARLYDPQQGRILVDGVDLRELEVRSWRRRLAVVTQDSVIFNDTVARNIAFGRDGVPEERLRAAARLAAADGFIAELPQGYQTMLGDRGVRLSGGQQQRIAIARAILADPDLLVLDEATSNLDALTERAIQQAMEEMSKGRTLLVVAHRLSTIRKADKVVVMDGGRLVEVGRHHDLLARRGIYWEMVANQRLDLVDGATADPAEA